MDKLLTFILGALAVAAGIVLIVVLHVVFGALGGWIIGWFFGDVILATLSRFGIDTLGLEMWQLGATLAFVGAYFKAHQAVTTSKKG